MGFLFKKYVTCWFILMQVQCASNESQALTRAIEMINWGILRKVNSTLYILRPEEICKHSQSLLVHWFGGVCLRFIDKYLFFSKQAIGKKIIIAWITFCNRTFRVGQLEQRLVTRCRWCYGQGTERIMLKLSACTSSSASKRTLRQFSYVESSILLTQNR